MLNKTSIQELEKSFIGGGEVRGFKFTQLQEGDGVFLYEIENEYNGKHYEVFVQKTVQLCIDFSTKTYSGTDRKEVYPKGKDFGSWAWSYRKKEDAIKKFNDLVTLNNITTNNGR